MIGAMLPDDTSVIFFCYRLNYTCLAWRFIWGKKCFHMGFELCHPYKLRVVYVVVEM